MTRTARIDLRLDPSEKERIEARAERARMTVSAYLVACALGERHDAPDVTLDAVAIAVAASDHAAEAIHMGGLARWDDIGGDYQAANLADLEERLGRPVTEDDERLYSEGYDATIGGAIAASER